MPRRFRPRLRRPKTLSGTGPAQPGKIAERVQLCRRHRASNLLGGIYWGSTVADARDASRGPESEGVVHGRETQGRGLARPRRRRRRAGDDAARGHRPQLASPACRSRSCSSSPPSSAWSRPTTSSRSTRRSSSATRSAAWSPGSTRTRSTSTRRRFKEFREATTGRFVGIGIEMGMEDGLVKVVSPIEGSPAFRAGLKSGDLITKIDDTLVKGLTVDQAVKRMRGEPNTKVVLTIFRKNESRTFPVTIIARGDPHAERSRQDDRAGLRLDARQPVPGSHGRGLRQQGRGPLQAGPEPQGPGARPAQRPGRPARGRGRDLGGVPAERRRWSSRPTARSPIRRRPSRRRPSTTSAAAAPTRCGACPTRSRRCR